MNIANVFHLCLYGGKKNCWTDLHSATTPSGGQPLGTLIRTRLSLPLKNKPTAAERTCVDGRQWWRQSRAKGPRTAVTIPNVGLEVAFEVLK